MILNLTFKACTGGSIEIFYSLYNVSSNLNIQNSNGYSPLMLGMEK